MTSQTQAQTLSDEELVRLTLADQEDFLHLVDRYRAPLTKYILRLTNARVEDAEDILQDALIKVYLNLNGFDGNLKFSSWIYRIVHNQVISQYRKIKARPEGHAVDTLDQAAKNLAAEMNIAAGVDSNILKEKFIRLMDLLPEKYREALVLRFWEEKSYQEISDIIRKPAGTVASTINKAKRELRRLALKNDIKL